MAASDFHQRLLAPSAESGPASARQPSPAELLSPGGLQQRLEEEINRAARHGTPLSCLLVSIEDLEELATRHGRQLPEQALVYAGPTLQRELRSFDRVGRASESELAVLLPGADGPRGEIVARRLLERLRAIKVEAAGIRRALRVSIGLAAWREDLSADQLMQQARSAAQRDRNGLGNGLANGFATS
jgi:diguanylate cyclase (GGDEF)-like protein